MEIRRKFSSYGPISLKSNFGVPRTKLIQRAVNQLLGDKIEEGGHYFTVWAPRQTGKTWVLQRALAHLLNDNRFYVVKCNLQVGKIGTSSVKTTNYIIEQINGMYDLSIPKITTEDEFQSCFSKNYFNKPLILILDEFDSLEPDTIQTLVGEFRNMYIRRNEPGAEKHNNVPQLHGVALIGVRSVLGVENIKGSPFNVQRSMRIPNLTFDEVKSMFADYQKEYGQEIDPAVVEKLFYETAGQPGLTSWFGELLTEPYNPGPGEKITMETWESTWLAATRKLPDNNAMNIIAKAKTPEYNPAVLSLFQTDRKIPFTFDDHDLNYLYMNGIITFEDETDPVNNETGTFAKFSSPYIQKRLFNRFSRDLYKGINPVLDPFDKYTDVFIDDELHLRPVIRRYEKWLVKNAWHLFEKVPRRADLRIYEAVYHFNIYYYLMLSLKSSGVSVVPEFPTGNGKIDLILMYNTKKYGVELKSWSNYREYLQAIKQVAHYGDSLGLKKINLLFFIETIDDANRTKYETEDVDGETGVQVIVSFAETHNGKPPK